MLRNNLLLLSPFKWISLRRQYESFGPQARWLNAGALADEKNDF